MISEIYTFSKGVLCHQESEVVAEYPLTLHVNGKEIATLIASPHDLRFLVAGFLRLQGFVESVQDFLALSICSDFGAASVTIRGEVPERLKPVLTSGCGTGIAFHLPKVQPRLTGRGVYSPESIFLLMEEMSRRSERYRAHGGMHSAAVGKGAVFLHAEDIGRHNTIDRIAGEALLKGISLAGTMLATSGRVSTELVAKASLLGIELVASRTSPTEMAIKMAREAGITLVGYVRGGRFNVYSEPQRIAAPVMSVAATGAAA